MSRLRTGFVLGYHGCEGSVADKLLEGDAFVKSDKDFDWLGPGAYFWESDPDRARHWATDRHGARAFKAPTVIGAVIDLGSCLDLTTFEGLSLLKSSYDSFVKGQTTGGLPLPINENLRGDPTQDRVLRRLDCSIIKHLHQNMEDDLRAWTEQGNVGVKPSELFDSVRGMFPEGGEAFPGSGFQAKTHTQIAVLNEGCIKGVFRLRS